MRGPAGRTNSAAGDHLSELSARLVGGKQNEFCGTQPVAATPAVPQGAPSTAVVPPPSET